MLRIYDHYIDIIYEYILIFSKYVQQHTLNKDTYTQHIHTRNIIFKGNANANLNKNL